MNDFLHKNCNGSECKEEEQVTAMDIIHEYISSDIDDDEVELYEIMANDVSEYIDDINSDFLSEVNRPSFVALAGYVDREHKDKLLNDWLPYFEKKARADFKSEKEFLTYETGF